jgi:VWFA-related protein
MTTRVLFAGVAIAILGAIGVSGAQEPVFRARADAVIVSVAVRSRNHPVRGLTAADFELVDNGVRQEITSTSMEAIPVDVAFVLDTSGSVQGATFATLKSDVQNMADMLKADDRVRLVTFASRVRDVLGLQPGTASLPLDRMTAGGRTSFYNALAAALMISPGAERPQLVFAVTDGFDHGSFMDPRRLMNLASYSSATVYLALVPESEVRNANYNVYELGVGTPVRQGEARAVPQRKMLQDVIAATGGVVFPKKGALPPVFRQVLDDFRTTYVLRYTPQGVTRGGWHELKVTVPKHTNYEVRARKGYEGS